MIGGKYSRILVRKPEGKRPLGKPWCRWKRIQGHHKETLWGCGLASAASG